jgi:hypothetical protein
MNSHYFFLLLLVVLSTYSESPKYANPPNSSAIGVTVCSNSSSAQLGILAPVWPQNEVYKNPPQYEVYKTPPQYEVYKTPPQYEVYKTLPQYEVYKNPPQYEVYKTPPQYEVYKNPPQYEVYKTPPQYEVYKNPPQYEVYKTQPQYEVYRISLPQNEVFETVLPQLGIATVNYQLSNRVKHIIIYVLNLGVKGIKHLTSNLTHGAGKFCWAIRILLECLQHVLKMYTWCLSENQASIHIRCRLTGLLLKKTLFRKHDFAACVYRLYHFYQNLFFQHLMIFSTYKFGSCAQIREKCFKISNQFPFHGGGKSLIFSSDELIPYALADLQEQQYQFLHCVKKNNKQSIILGDGDILCSVPLNILTPKLTLKTAKELALLHDMYMPSKILLKNAQILLQDHRCHTCDDFLAVFKPYKVFSNAERQKTWYQENTEKRAKYDKH